MFSVSASALFPRPLAPRCLSCRRRLQASEFPAVATPFQTQFRGKKKRPNRDVKLYVRLLRDTTGFGPKGSIVPCTPARMRNIWYPFGRAEYVTQATLRDMKGSLGDRDYHFGKGSKESSTEVGSSKLPDLEVEHLATHKARKILDAIIPQSLEFYRTPTVARTSSISSAKQEDMQQKSDTLSPATVAHTPSSTSGRTSRRTPIYGSVSTADIASSISALLTREKSAVWGKDIERVVVDPEDITFSSQDGSATGLSRIKETGEFDFEIALKGGEAIRRRVRVIAEQAKK